jgi:RNA recognition motif-containing protein
MKVYLGNLPTETTDSQLRDMVKAFGTPSTAEVVKDKASGMNRGFGFAEFSNDDEARAVIAGLNGKDVNGKTLKVNEAKSKK